MFHAFSSLHKTFSAFCQERWNDAAITCGYTGDEIVHILPFAFAFSRVVLFWLLLFFGYYFLACLPFSSIPPSFFFDQGARWMESGGWASEQAREMVAHTPFLCMYVLGGGGFPFTAGLFLGASRIFFCSTIPC